MDQIEQLACETALKKMIADGHLSICTINDIVKITGGIPDRRAHQILDALHCVKYADMPAPLLAELPDLIRKCLGGPIIDVDAIFTATARPRPGLKLCAADVEATPPRRRLFGT